ncbi:MAG: hypothetical protein ACI8WB_003802, partial [Phenylobacterium sp.]
MGLILILLCVWATIGGLVWLWGGRNADPHQSSIARKVQKHLCLVGDKIEVEVNCATAAFPPSKIIEEDAQPWDVVLMLDRSSSMGCGHGSALEEAKQSALTMVRSMPQDFRFAVVEFNHDAQEIVPLSYKNEALEHAIINIEGSGSTDLALGLQVAEQCLRNHDKNSDRKVAVILLSDGESDRDEALAAADQLKEQDLLLLTVAVGDADPLLLRYIASTPQNAYQADNIDALGALYQQIGQMITAKHATNVRVNGTFDASGNWGLRDWGDIKPIQQALGKGQFCWLLPALQHEPISLRYSLEALRPGWHKIAQEPATLQVLWDGQPLEMASGNRTRVLVLPSLPGWQFLWLLLNPLWYLLFGRFYRRSVIGDAIEKATPVAPEPIAMPPTINAPRSPLADINQRPTLVIGLGFGGTHSLVHCKRLSWERGTRVDSDKLRFLAIDIASSLFFPAQDISRAVTLGDEERLHLHGQLEPVIKAEAQNPEPRYPWLPAQALLAGGARPDLQQGTGHQRTLGRLAIFENKDLLSARIKPLLKTLIDTGDERGIDILITGTTAGGTSSGCLLDLCWLLRCLLVDMSAPSAAISLFLSAPVASESVASDNREKMLRNANHQALMSELDRIAVTRAELQAPLAGLPPQRNWFDRVFCIGGDQRQPWPAFTELYPKTGEMLFNWLAASADQGLRQHFQALESENARQSTIQGRCMVQRVAPNSLYLYPRTIKRYLVVESLRRSLAHILWANDGGVSVYRAFENQAPMAPDLLNGWKEDQTIGILPWVLQSGSVFSSTDEMRQRLLVGAGPGICSAASPLAQGEFLREQKQLLDSVLDCRLSHSLNSGWGTLCQPHDLITNLHALLLLHNQLTEAQVLARLLNNSAVEPMVKNETALVTELSEQGATLVQSKINELQLWDQCLGEGVKQLGVMRYLDQQLGLLQHEVGQLMEQPSPRLPLEWAQIEGLSEQFITSAIDSLQPR